MTRYQIDFEPIGRRITVSEGASLLSAAQDAGVSLTAVCGGVGACLACKVRCLSGDLTKVQIVERDVFSEEALTQGWRLACQAFPRSDLKVEVPPESMTTTQRLQLEGDLRQVELSPAVTAHDFSLKQPDLTDLRADWERFTDEFTGSQEFSNEVDIPVLSQFSSKMRELGWSGRVVLRDNHQVAGFLAQNQPFFGVAVDIGTTKMAGYLIDLTSGTTIARVGVMNPQISYGEDVVSRIAYANQGSSYRLSLQKQVVESLNNLVRELCKFASVDEAQIVDYVVVGNTAMHHLFAGLSVRQLGQAPYVAAVSQAIHFPAREIGLTGAPGAHVYLPPNIAGYVGADHVAMLLASDLQSKSGVSLALDVGTNTEISLSKEGRLVSCSCASGPAFEGAHIHAGMRAAPGAIEKAQFFDGDWHISTIDDLAPIGICGSGILDVVAVLLESGQIDSTGRFTDNAYRRVDFKKGGAVELVPSEGSGTGKPIFVTRSDIREIQLAKAAIRAGVSVLLHVTETDPTDIDHFLVAGAFGTYLSIESAIKIGMFPKIPRSRYQQIGNAAGAGAQQMLISKQNRIDAENILSRMSYIELTTDPGFMESYVDSMGFPMEKDET